ncbi:hypothetical protein S245_030329 [Arachis hypogaea]
MVKFSKELEAQLIPEWKEAFVNYWQLKKQIKRIRLSRLPTNPPHTAQLFAGVDFGRSIFDSLRSIAANLADNLRPSCDDHNLTVIQKLPIPRTLLQPRRLGRTHKRNRRSFRG